MNSGHALWGQVISRYINFTEKNRNNPENILINQFTAELL